MMDNKELILRLAMTLDTSLEHLDRAAEQEKRQEAGKSLRKTTYQIRAKAARELVAEAFAVLDIDGFD